MIMLEPCKKCRKKDAITVVSQENLANHRKIWVILCNRCEEGIKVEAENQDDARRVWNAFNKPPEGPIQ